MNAGLFSVYDGVLGATRLPSVSRAGRRIAVADVATLVLAGAAAASAAGFLRLGLRIPGSSILLAMVPMALGFSLVPRRFAGVIMSGSALVTAGAFASADLAGYGVGALTSLCLTGPSMDVAMRGAGPGWTLYLRLVGAGLATNLLAFLQRGASKVLALDKPGTRLFDEWLSQAAVTYTLSGAVAGLIAAICWFQFTARKAGTDPGADA